jgi:hypothetical protein
MTSQFMKEVDKMLDGMPPDLSVITKFKGTVRGRSGDLMVMAAIANRAVERKKNGKSSKSE